MPAYPLLSNLITPEAMRLQLGQAALCVPPPRYRHASGQGARHSWSSHAIPLVRSVARLLACCHKLSISTGSVASNAICTCKSARSATRSTGQTGNGSTGMVQTHYRCVELRFSLQPHALRPTCLVTCPTAGLSIRASFRACRNQVLPALLRFNLRCKRGMAPRPLYAAH
jgi:hypothetical protein